MKRITITLDAALQHFLAAQPVPVRSAAVCTTALRAYLGSRGYPGQAASAMLADALRRADSEAETA